MQMFVICPLLWFVFTIPGPWDLQRTMGEGVVAVGLSGIAVSRYHLGRSFSIRAEAHRLVTHGIYSKIRNPIYVFGILLFAGLVLVIHRPILWLGVLAIGVLQTLRARREARVLEAAFGGAYPDYRRRTWF